MDDSVSFTVYSRMAHHTVASVFFCFSKFDLLSYSKFSSVSEFFHVGFYVFSHFYVHFSQNISPNVPVQ